MLFDTPMSDKQIEEWLSTLPDDTGSHPLLVPARFTPPNCPTDDAKRMRVSLIDLGQGMFSHCLLWITKPI